MSSVVEAVPTIPAKPNFSLWLKQIRAIFWLEIEKNFFSRRSILIYLLALLPLLPLTVIAIFQPNSNEFRDFRQLSLTYAFLYNGLILQTVVFFGCAWIFMNLFRGELVDRSLHYYFLSSVRREVLVVEQAGYTGPGGEPGWCNHSTRIAVAASPAPRSAAFSRNSSRMDALPPSMTTA